MSKYVDLAGDIHADDDVSAFWFEVVDILNWLDSHPDQVPGRTITESEYDRLTAHRLPTFGDGFDAGMLAVGGGVVPDPEPTNAEKLHTLISETQGWCGTLAYALDEAGVKAPDHD